MKKPQEIKAKISQGKELQKTTQGDDALKLQASISTLEWVLGKRKSIGIGLPNNQETGSNHGLIDPEICSLPEPEEKTKRGKKARKDKSTSIGGIHEKEKSSVPKEKQNGKDPLKELFDDKKEEMFVEKDEK